MYPEMGWLPDRARSPYIGIEYPFPGITQDIEQPQVIGLLPAYRVHPVLCVV